MIMGIPMMVVLLWISGILLHEIAEDFRRGKGLSFFFIQLQSL